jgi:hypothetical protein
LAFGLRQVLDDVCAVNLAGTRDAMGRFQIADEQQLVREVAATGGLREVAEPEVDPGVVEERLKEV